MFKNNMVYIKSLRLAWATQRDAQSQKEEVGGEGEREEEEKGRRRN